MSELVKRHILCIQALNRYKNNKLRKAILANADADLICALAECAYNILKGNVPLTPTHRRRLKELRELVRDGCPSRGGDTSYKNRPVVSYRLY